MFKYQIPGWDMVWGKQLRLSGCRGLQMTLANSPQSPMVWAHGAGALSWR